jgi:predicted Ser/Thr protein kinase
LADTSSSTPLTATPTSEAPTSIPGPPPRRPSAVEAEREIATVRLALQDDYDVVAELGRGGMACVYLANERQLEREVAIKVLRPALAADNDFVERFKHEARTAGKLEHPNIVPIYRVGQSGHTIYFVMKYLRGQSLGAVLRERGKLEVHEIRRILLETAAALGYAARQNVVHRDVKPDNILLDHEGRCVVTDFGIAKGPGGNVTAPGTSLGTPRYMSPEHAQGTPLDGRSDMYSLGVVAYQCLTGVTPFNADDPFAILYKHINEAIPRPTFANADEESLYNVIERMLAKKAENRFQTANDLILALGGEVTGPILADASGKLTRALVTPTLPMTTPLPMTIRTRLRRMGPQQRMAWGGGAVLAVVATIILAATLGRRTPPVAKDTTAARPAVASTAGAGASTSVATQSGDTSSAARVTPAGALASATATKQGAAATKGTTTSGAAPLHTTSSLSSVSSRASTRTTAGSAASSQSRCPRATGSAATQIMSVLVDSIPQQTTGGTLDLGYDVCGLTQNAPFSADFMIRKVDQSRLRRLVRNTVKPLEITVPEVASGPRSRKRRSIPLAGLPAGSYTLDVTVTDSKSRKMTTTRNFVVVDKPGT